MFIQHALQSAFVDISI